MKNKEGLHYKLIELFGDEREMAEEGLIFDVSQQLFEVMEKDKVTKAELAKRLDCSKAYVTKLLRGPSNMTLRKAAEVFFALGRVLKVEAVPAGEERDGERAERRDAGDESGSPKKELSRPRKPSKRRGAAVSAKKGG